MIDRLRRPGLFFLVLAIGTLLAGTGGHSLQAAPSISELSAYVKRNPNNVKAVYYLGRLHAKQDSHAQAIRLYMYLLKKKRVAGSTENVSPKMRVELLNRIGLSYFRSKDLKRAEKVWSYVLSRFPDDGFARKGLMAIRKLNGSGGGAAPGGTGGPGGTAPPPVAEPKVSPEEAKKGFDEGMSYYDQGLKAVGAGNLENAHSYFAGAREQFQIAIDGRHRLAEASYYAGMSFIKEGTVDIYELEQARDFLEAALAKSPNDKKITPEITFGLASAYGLLDENENEILYYEKTIDSLGEEDRPELKADAHFRASLAYDKAKTADWSAKSFEHAKKAIKIDPNYKKKFQPMIRNSRVAKEVASIIHEIIQKSEDSQIPDDQAAEYAERIGKILGDNNIKSEMLGEGGDKESLKEMIKDPQKRQRLREMWDKSAQADPEKVQDMLDNASGEDKAKIDKFLSNPSSGQKLQKYLGNSKLQDAVNQLQE